MFSNNWEYLLQQNDSRLLTGVQHLPVRGKERRISQLGAIDMRPVVTRNGQTVPQDTPMSARWLRVRGYDAVTWLDEWDEISLGDLPLPKSEHVVQHSNAAKRKMDDIVINAALGAAYTGVDGTTPVALPSSQMVAVDYVPTGSAVNSGMTLAKLIRASYLLDKAEVPRDGGRYLVMGSKQFSDLLQNVDQVSNSRYSDVHALVDGEITRFMGFTFIRSERLPLDVPTDVRTCFAWHRDGIVFGDAEQPKTRMDILPTQNHSIQIRTTLVAGAVRRQEEYVVAIFCDESP